MTLKEKILLEDKNDVSGWEKKSFSTLKKKEREK